METIYDTEKLERLTQKEITRFFMYLIDEIKLNPQKFNESYRIGLVNVNDNNLMTKVTIELLPALKGSKKTKYLYTDNHAMDYSCSNISLSPID